MPYKTKSPVTPDWMLRENRIVSLEGIPPKTNFGLMHAYSGTCAIDIDDIEKATKLLAEAKIDLEKILNSDAVQIVSGRKNKAKLLYTTPLGLAYPSRKFKEKNKDVLDFRCGTANDTTVQDVLPPSVHPLTLYPYTWKGDYTKLTQIPDELFHFWQKDNDVRIDPKTTTIDPSWANIESALEWVSPDCSRMDWIKIGMALHGEGERQGDIARGFSVWNAWSFRSTEKYPGERAIKVQWASFCTDRHVRVAIGTVFWHAGNNGWYPPQPDTAMLYEEVKTEFTAKPKIRTDLRPVPPDLNLKPFPTVLRQRCEEVASSVGCDPIIPLFAGLSAVCAVVDARIRLRICDGWEVPPILWLMTIGIPGNKKTHGSKPMLESLKDLEMKDVIRFKADLLRWEGDEARYAKSKKAFLDYMGSADAIIADYGAAPEVFDLGAQPVPLRFTVSDITSQKLVRFCAERPRGVLCYLDEMHKWTRKLSDKNSGEDRSAWVVSYEGSRYEMDRVGAGSIVADNLSVAIYGNIQPTVFREVQTTLASDGLLQRFIPAVLRDEHVGIGKPLPEWMQNTEEWANVLRVIFTLAPTTYSFSADAYGLFRKFQVWYDKKRKDEVLLNADITYLGAFSKIEGVCGRLCLMFHLIENPTNNVIDEDTVARVITFIKKFIIPSLRYTFGEAAGVDSFDAWLCDWLIQHADIPRVSVADIRRGARRRLEKFTLWESARIIFAAMYPLEKANWVKQLPGEREERTQWVLNPDLKSVFARQREEVLSAKKRSIDLQDDEE